MKRMKKKIEKKIGKGLFYVRSTHQVSDGVKHLVINFTNQSNNKQN